MMFHEPVLLNETLEYLITKKSGIYFDGTVGFGGHSEAILNELETKAALVGTDKDIEAFEFSTKKFAGDKRFEIFNTGFTDIESIAKLNFINGFDGIFADLGVSSFQLDNKNAGFTYRENAPLDMRMNKKEGKQAADIINSYDEENLANIIYEYGEEKRSRVIARKIVQARKQKKISTTFDLKEIIQSSVPQKHLNKTLSRVFQSLRIYVNNELDELKEFLGKSVNVLNSGGRIVILTYHSLEDRIVKEFFKYESLTCVCPPEMPICTCEKEASLKIITRKPLIPADDEINRNPRSRSAKLRAAEKI